ncbi:MAG TPA: sugar transferase [Acidimicrobiia bacterium]|nr:sugar transferase [Acidimicrobiia bacterium]
MFDFLVAAVLLAVLAIPMAILYMITRLMMGAPVLYKTQRPGLGGRLFTMYKFRTMTDEVDATGRLLPDDARLTSFGQLLRSWSLDELPELINVLKGDMSLVGPRPLLPEYLSRYSADQARRHETRPGITGWSQVNGRNELDWDQRLALDIWYVDNRSFLLDLKILLKTVTGVLKREGISAKGHATMQEFRGSDEP